MLFIALISEVSCREREYSFEIIISFFLSMYRNLRYDNDKFHTGIP